MPVHLPEHNLSPYGKVCVATLECLKKTEKQPFKAKDVQKHGFRTDCLHASLSERLCNRLSTFLVSIAQVH